jgi:hypothetical protein
VRSFIQMRGDHNIPVRNAESAHSQREDRSKVTQNWRKCTGATRAPSRTYRKGPTTKNHVVGHSEQVARRPLVTRVENKAQFPTPTKQAVLPALRKPSPIPSPQIQFSASPPSDLNPPPAESQNPEETAKCANVPNAAPPSIEPQTSRQTATPATSGLRFREQNGFEMIAKQSPTGRPEAIERSGKTPSTSSKFAPSKTAKSSNNSPSAPPKPELPSRTANFSSWNRP